MRAELIPFHSDSQITEFGLTIFDFYQRANYVKIDAEITNGEAYLILIETALLKCAIPVIKKQIFSNHVVQYYDLASPYGYPGMIFNNFTTDEELRLCFSMLNDLLSQHNVVSLFIRMHPIINTMKLPDLFNTQQVTHGPIVFIEFTDSIKNITENYSSNHKRGIKKLIGMGYSCRLNDWSQYEKFVLAYYETMQFVLAEKYYYFNEHYFAEIRKILGHSLHLITAHDKNGDFTSGALFVDTNGLIQYHLGGSLNISRIDASSKLIFDYAIKHFHQAGKDKLLLGGGLGSGQDDLFRFKSGFSKQTARFQTIRCIILDKIYNELNNNINSKNLSEFFPAYRS